MPESETIKGLERGLKVLQALQTSATASLHEIHLATQISKPSLLRILNTLVRASMVSRRLADGRYRLSAFAGMARKGDRHDRVAEAAGPVLDRLCQKVLWPSDLLVPAGGHMQRRETSRAHSRFALLPLAHMTSVGQPVGWLLTAVGRVYLAHCSDKEREAIVRRLRKTGKPEDRLANDPKRLERILAETRTRGYGTRDPIYLGGMYGEPPADDGLAAIAVALVDGNRVHGSINILWIRTAFTVEEFAARHLADLKAAAAEIVAALPAPARSRAPRYGLPVQARQ
jgi:IclR family mhp operon transcriptional activator